MSMSSAVFAIDRWLLFFCTFLYLQEEIELQDYVQHKDGQPVMSETSNLAREELDNERSGAFSANERKVCYFSYNSSSNFSTESILAFRDSH